ncbi:UbiA family prenyltransferase [Crossiella cryophila]|uniref:1,4-dihydroxy-2-naphthoate octaprenyltransferase n=1 Tax=Crossiella cryophila TaxID=43355 RepID=A0A7W7FVH3_9PSEU|nr:UbiA family prenyltransferase [Crossiella cryophila]MBB4680421.1 1,4-dihydroxy-2-naphthoate octaprenyltransferase [Crossiella cryophila]
MRTVALPAEGRLRTYARLSKLDIFDYYLSLPLVLTLLPISLLAEPGILVLLGLFLAGEIILMASLVAFDDLTGYRDGSDAINYGPDAPARRMLRKPLVAGTLTEHQVLRFAWGAFLVGALCWAGAVWLAPAPPLWALVLTGVMLVLYPQYSYGLKLSYIGCQEFYLAFIGWVLVLAPLGLAGGELTGFTVVQALLFGLGPLLFGVYSNTNDVRGDRSVGRITVATKTSVEGNRLFVLALTLAEMALIVGSSALEIAPWWFAFALAPTLILRALQFGQGFRDCDILRARRLGIHVHRITVALLIVINLVVRQS